MTPEAILEAIAIPVAARVDRRVPKKMLTEQGAPTSADKRAIQDGIGEVQWIAVLKPTTIGVPAYKDDTSEYLEIAVITAELRAGAKVLRLTELIHRAVPYPVILVTHDGAGTSLSLAHKRASQSEKAAVVLDGVMTLAPLGAEPDAETAAFVDSLKLSRQPQNNLRAMYQGWIDCCAGLAASRLTGVFKLPHSTEEAAQRRLALDIHARAMREIAGLRAKAARETQINRRVELNLAIKRLEEECDSAVAMLRGNG
jgi:hypothetical protein